MHGQTHGGKGSAQRPVNRAKFEANWDAIFSKKSNEQVSPKVNYKEAKVPEVNADYAFTCNGCGQHLTAEDVWTIEFKELYEVGGRDVWETFLEYHCEYCGSYDIEDFCHD